MFHFATATKIVFGAGMSKYLGSLTRTLVPDDMGDRALVVTGSTPARVEAQLDSLRRSGFWLDVVRVESEPSVELALDGVARAQAHRANVVVAIGGGSAIDAGKAIAALMTNPGRPLDYLEVVGRGQALSKDPAPFVAVPTTAGTGAEVTKNAVLCSTKDRVKVSLRSDRMLPRLAIVDSELTYSVSRDVTIATGLDALTQVLEPYVSRAANPLTDALCVEALRRVRSALPRVVDAGDDAAARDDMAFVSLCGGLALANAKLGAVHGFAGPLGGMFDAPHGALCARLLPEVMQVNVAALSARDASSAVLERYRQVAELLTGEREASIEAGIDWVRALCERFAIPGLSSYGLNREAFGELIPKARSSSSMQGNPIDLAERELVTVLEQALEPVKS